MRGKQIAGVAGALIGAFIAFLGLFWTLQGTGILQIRPVYCVTNCEEIVGVSPLWAIAGAIAFIIGIIIIVMSVRHVRAHEIQGIKKPECNSNH